MGINLDLLSEQAILGAALTRLSPLGTAFLADEGSVLYREGDALDTLYLVQDGSVMTEVMLSSGPAVPVDITGRGGVLGLSDLGEGTHGETARTLSPCRLIRLTPGQVHDLAGSSAETALLLVGLLSVGLRHRIRAIADQRSLSARGRLMAFLLSLMPGRRSGSVTMRLPVSKTTLAAHLGITPQSLSRSLRSLRDDGVTVRGALVTVADPADLRHAMEAERDVA
ncbi:Crp/Fnr family transcriptional regulator [Novispirillum itersonii]|uniref:CRP-like cAMP-binding protein n=1 Tax=Novispirillum itersonii TaxID=189 RepID=A0A7X0DKW1_NOVIT|nr:Crp/Fnr family transcriptional regulator [Novispirillum itersonii]MBB6209356.1 CRP-like cAMP-binding protein [Novispirillum itersonii]